MGESFRGLARADEDPWTVITSLYCGPTNLITVYSCNLPHYHWYLGYTKYVLCIMCLTPNMWKVQLDVDKIAKSGQDDAMTVLQLFRTQSN